jgi:hypothetical protein
LIFTSETPFHDLGEMRIFRNVIEDRTIAMSDGKLEITFAKETGDRNVRIGRDAEGKSGRSVD